MNNFRTVVRVKESEVPFADAERLPARIEPPTAQEPTNLLAVIAAASKDPAVDMDKFERLLKMKREIEMEERERVFDAAMSAAQKEMRPVVVDKANSQTNSKYASYAALDNAVRPIYTDHGFALTFNMGAPQAPDQVRVLCHVSHEGGFARDYHIDMPADGKGAKGGDVMTKTHATGSATRYGMRYLLIMIFNIPTTDRVDDDGNAAGNRAELLSFEQVEQIEAAIVEKIGPQRRAKLLHHFQAESFEDLPAKRFGEIMAVINEAAKMAAARERSNG